MLFYSRRMSGTRTAPYRTANRYAISQRTPLALT
jgi:hypothetical protein